jgi:hypothetical protein
MHPIDEAIFHGTLTAELLATHASLPLAPPAHSYWCDRMREGKDALAAAQLAARDMGASLASLHSLT